MIRKIFPILEYNERDTSSRFRIQSFINLRHMASHRVDVQIPINPVQSLLLGLLLLDGLAAHIPVSAAPRHGGQLSSPDRDALHDAHITHCVHEDAQL